MGVQADRQRLLGGLGAESFWDWVDHTPEEDVGFAGGLGAGVELLQGAHIVGERVITESALRGPHGDLVAQTELVEIDHVVRLLRSLRNDLASSLHHFLRHSKVFLICPSQEVEWCVLL